MTEYTCFSLPEIITQKAHLPYFSDKELDLFEKHWGNTNHYKVSIDVSKSLFSFFEAKVEKTKNRRGEVLPIIFKDGKILFHTKSRYPDGIYRLLTGGLGHDEKIIDCLSREIFEETGYISYSSNLTAIIWHNIIHKNKTIPFPTFCFTIKDISTEPIIQDETEDITDFKWVSPYELNYWSRQMKSIKGEWSDWGKMRAIAHDIIMQQIS